MRGPYGGVLVCQQGLHLVSFCIFLCVGKVVAPRFRFCSNIRSLVRLFCSCACACLRVIHENLRAFGKDALWASRLYRYSLAQPAWLIFCKISSIFFSNWTAGASPGRIWMWGIRSPGRLRETGIREVFHTLKL